MALTAPRGERRSYAETERGRGKQRGKETPRKMEKREKKNERDAAEGQKVFANGDHKKIQASLRIFQSEMFVITHEKEHV